MRILWLDHSDRVHRYDRYLHTDFAIYLRKAARIWFYGPKMKATLPGDTIMEYDPNLSFRELTRMLNIDCVVLDTRSAMYHNYYPATLYPDKHTEKECWLPYDFAGTDILKIMLEEDYHYEIDDTWHRNMGIDVILHRHFSQFKRRHKLAKRFFPFSVDIDMFNPITDKPRKNKVCLTGSCIEDIYVYRNRARIELGKHNLIDTFISQEKIHKDYFDCLKEYKCHLSGTSRYDITPAKTFEIMASGSILLTNESEGLKECLDENSYITYNDEATDVARKAKEILNNEQHREEMIVKALSCIYRKHTHEVRALQFLEIIQELL